MFWKKLKWKWKGFIIGLIIPFLLYLLGSINPFIELNPLILVIIALPVLPLLPITIYLADNSTFHFIDTLFPAESIFIAPLFLLVFIAPLIWALIGFFIGYILEKKYRKK